MKFDHLHYKQELVRTSLLLVSAAAALVIFVRAADYAVASAKASKIIKEASKQGQYDANDTDKYLLKSKGIAEELKNKNLFVPPQQKKHPVEKVTAIMGNEAYINGKWYKAGDRIADANIVSIEPSYVKILWQGKEKDFSPFDVKTPEAVKKEEKKPEEKVKAEEPKEVKESAVEVKEVVEEDPLAWIGVKLSAKLRAKFLEKWNSMSDEEKAQAKEQWSKMSDEQKEQIVQQMEQNVDKL